MACPLFVPSSPLGELVLISTPLGDLYGGACAAEPTATISTDTLRSCCNFGYARDRCERAAQSDADAVRLLVRNARGSVVEIAWALERNHHPVAVGAMQIDTGSTAEPPGNALAGQAYACAMAYARQTQRIPNSAGQIAAAAHR